MAVLITVAALHPRAMGPLLEELLKCVGANSEKPKPLRGLLAVVVRKVKKRHPRVLGGEEVGQLLNANIPKDVAVRDLQLPDIHLLQSFSFCGEVDPERPELFYAQELMASADGSGEGADSTQDG